MSLVSWDPFRELEEVSTRLNRFFGHVPARGALARPNGAAPSFDWSPTADVIETPEEFQVKAELPDVKRDDVKVSLEGRTLVIQGERKRRTESKEEKYHRVERSYGSFVRSFTLPADVDEAKIRAEYKNGVLDVRLPKLAPAKVKQIDVHAG
jgi:HSP20 family protein